MAKLLSFSVHPLDVWGNARDGYDVNDVYPSVGTVRIREGATDKQIVDALRRGGFLQPRVRTSRVRIEGEPEYALSISDNKDGRPEYELRLKRG